jgi:glycerol-3-phosphate acyltransferase PlsY
MLASIGAVICAYLLGSVPVAYIGGRFAGGVDLRKHGSGNLGASNIWQTLSSRWLVIPVGVAQVGQGLSAVLIARALDQGDGMQATCGLAAVVAHDWNPWLRFTGGRGIGATIGVLLALSPWALAVFAVIALTGVIARAVPQCVALALASTPFVAAIAGEPGSTVAGFSVLLVVALVKRLAANGPPHTSAPRPQVWMHRLVFDRDIRDREAWVRRDHRLTPET